MNYYNILQINENATDEEIKKAYHKMARLFHPDNFKGSASDAEEHMALINEAYKVLSDKEKKRKYDESIHSYSRESLKEDYQTNNVYERKKEDKGNSDEYDNTTQQYSEREEKYDDIYDSKHREKKSSSCLSTIIEWIVYLIIIYWLINHFGIVDKAKNIINQMDKYTSFLEDIKVKDIKLNKLDTPDMVVKNYLSYLKKGNSEEATKLFCDDYKERFSPITIAEYNKTITDLYYWYDSTIPMYPLFESIRKFEYKIDDVNYEDDEAKATVDVYIANYDVCMLTVGILSDYSKEELENKSDKELQKIVRNAIDKYGKDCLIDTEVTFELRKDGVDWKIQYMEPFDEFSVVVVGDANELILQLNDADGEEY